MKKCLLLLSFLMISIANVNAQETEEKESGFDKWSIELNGGVNKPTRTMSSGYYTKTFNLFHADLGVRYMFNPKFGVKLDFGYDKFEDGNSSAPFESTYLRTSLQGVVNIGRVLNFETWTNTFGLLAHGGFGASQLTSKNGFEGEDYMGNGILGLTGQIKLSNNVVLTGDITGIANGKQQHNFDGMSQVNTSAIDGIVMNASVGLTFYLGKNEKHADWYFENKTEEIEALEKRIAFIETGLVDTDKDGVADLYDLEQNTTTGVAVNSKGQAVDVNKNGVPDELESYLDKTYGQNGNVASNGTIEELINGGYVNVYFDFNSDTPTSSSVSGVDFLVKYLKANPSTNAQIIGYADEVGDASYNQALSQRRADAVKNIAVNSGISASRLTVVANGEDASVNKDSKAARQIVRRVTFSVK
ncbi:OmpA family protein [Flavobacterium aquatile]|uniref:Flagellar motor protein MotB n=1 Tax=Flavobacterium aquatile LMG 4008 = ATCC 11947 TaxID=1453498 RepID=A0A095SV04_9FLAO|nr:OmpA family protein [Flavobacterium aquatile]KGD68437.1 flagellar motor protein MotB [Flavobacterium aquatile LMG 4008 = ATCC 11947]OXA68634.1 flagellar motor protein MotB [Flavobacterium aquatile LMG 4008 = ATCC 11947]